MLAKGVAEHSRRCRSGWRKNSVLTPAKQRRGEKAGLIMKKGNANIAGKSSQRIGTAAQLPVREGVPLCYVGIKGIKPAGREPVFNMEVDGTHCFSVNGGAIVHNCMDDIRYFSFTVLRQKLFYEMRDYRDALETVDDQ